jgi:hypothetical protein
MSTHRGLRAGAACADLVAVSRLGAARGPRQAEDMSWPDISPGQDHLPRSEAEGVGFEPTVTLPPQWFSRACVTP